MEKIYTCKICGVTSDVAPFYKGVTSRCKGCHKEKVRENRAARVGYYREYDAKRFQNDPRVRARHKRYQATEAGKEAMKRSRAKWERSNPEKKAAQTILGNAVRDGRIDKPDCCTVCGNGGCQIEGHHHDYTKPLDVVWCCRQCHVDIHKGKHHEAR